jgi:multicomponent Na+:H+ antiporter subunit G
LIGEALDMASWVLLLAGSFFLIVGAIGLIRMPDFYTRMHAASVIDTLGVALILLGLMMQAGLSLITLKLIFLVALFFFTGPVVAHALAQAALQMGLEPILKEDRRAGPKAKAATPKTARKKSRS